MSAFHDPYARAADGTILIEFSEYDGNGYAHGVMEVRPGEPDHDLWSWILDRRTRFRRVSDEDLALIRDEFRQWQRGWVRWLWHRMTHRRRSGWVQSGRALE